MVSHRIAGPSSRHGEYVDLMNCLSLRPVTLRTQETDVLLGHKIVTAVSETLASGRNRCLLPGGPIRARE